LACTLAGQGSVNCACCLNRGPDRGRQVPGLAAQRHQSPHPL